MTRAETVKAAVEASDRAIILEGKGIEAIVLSKFTVAFYFDDKSNVTFRTSDFSYSLDIVAGEAEEAMRV